MTQRKAVDEFDRALLGPTALGAAQRETDALTALARRITLAGPALPGIDEAFRITLRERLVREASAVGAVPAARGRHAGRQPARGGSRAAGRSGSADQASVWRRRLLAAGIGVAVATGSVGGIAIASAGARPGDPLYSAKKMFENIQLQLSGSATDRGGQYLKLADTRLSEIDTLLARRDADVPGSPTAAYLKQALDDLQSMIGDGGNLLLGEVRGHGDQQAVHILSDFLLTERQRVGDLTWQVPLELQGQPPRIVALMDDLYSQLQAAVAALPNQGSPTPSSGASPGPGDTGPGTGASGTAGDGRTSAQGASTSAAASAAGGSGTAGASTSASASASATPTIAITLPLPILPSTGINLPPLLPGLPAIDLGLGGSGSTASSSPTD